MFLSHCLHKFHFKLLNIKIILLKGTKSCQVSLFSSRILIKMQSFCWNLAKNVFWFMDISVGINGFSWLSNPCVNSQAALTLHPPFSLASPFPVIVTDSHNFQADINLRNWSRSPILHFTEKESWSPQSLRDVPNMTQLANGNVFFFFLKKTLAKFDTYFKLATFLSILIE